MLLGRHGNDGELYCIAVDDARADFEQKASLHVYVVDSRGRGMEESSIAERGRAGSWLIVAVSQCQAIHARSIFPCQDTPDVKATVTFNIRSPLPVLASGLPTGVKNYEHGTLLYTFQQQIPIPSYLFAIASGDIAQASIGPRSVVATGPEELSAAKWEMENDMERFMEAAEVRFLRCCRNKLMWIENRQNSLRVDDVQRAGAPTVVSIRRCVVLSGEKLADGLGMENPIFTFATPTIVSGVSASWRRDLADVTGSREYRRNRTRAGAQLERESGRLRFLGAFLAQRGLDDVP